MDCCCCNNEDRKYDANKLPEGIQPCCVGQLCFCLPYDDGFMISSQVLAIVAVFLSWIWWVTFVISIVGLILFQIPWCCRQSRAPMYISAVAAGLAAMLSMGSGIYVLIAYYGVSHCSTFVFDSYSYESDWCREKLWATIAFVCTAVWVAAFGCLVYFVESGRYAKFEKKYSARYANRGVESEAVVGVASLAAADSLTATEAAPVVTNAAVVAVVPDRDGKNDEAV